MKAIRIVTVSINAQNDGKIVSSLPHSIQDVFMVIVDGEEWDDAHIDDNDVKFYFFAGIEKIEIIGNWFRLIAPFPIFFITKLNLIQNFFHDSI